MNKFKTPLLILTVSLFIGCGSPKIHKAHSTNKNIRTPNHPRMTSHDREHSDFRHDMKEKKKEQIKKYYEGKNEKSKKRIK